MSGNQQQQQRKQDAGNAANNSTIIGSSGGGSSNSSSSAVKPFPQDASTIGGNVARMLSSGGVSNSGSGGGRIAKKAMGVDSSAGLSAAIAMNGNGNHSNRSSSSRPALANTTKHNCNVAGSSGSGSGSSGTEDNGAFFLSSSAFKTKFTRTTTTSRADHGVGAGVDIDCGTNPIIPGGVGGGRRRRHHHPSKQQRQQLVPTAVSFRRSGGGKGSGITGSNESGCSYDEYGIIGSGCASSNIVGGSKRNGSGAAVPSNSTTSSNILLGGSTSTSSGNTTIHPPPGLTSNAGMKTGRNGLGHRTMAVVSPLSLRGDAANNNNATAKADVGTSNKTTKVATLKLSTQSSLYSPRANNISSSNSASNGTSSAASTTTATTRQLQWFTPIKQDEKDKDTATANSGDNAMVSTPMATPTTVATTPSHSNSLLLSGGGATPGGSGGECFLSSICSIDDDETATRTAATINARSILGRSGTTPKIPAVVTSISSNSGGRSSIVSPLPVLSDITNKNESANASNDNGPNDDGFITPRKADRNASVTPPPQNLKGDPRRQNKVKTELCLYYLKDVPCPFGERCNYAHGWDELRFKKLKDLERNGLVPNASQYRTHPCLSWITTGSCPFGQRCSSIHDPRVAGPISSW